MKVDCSDVPMWHDGDGVFGGWQMMVVVREDLSLFMSYS